MKRAALPARNLDCGSQAAPRHPEKVDAAVIVEILVFSGQVGVDHERRDILDGHEDALLPRKLGDQQAVAGMDPAHDGRLVLGKLLVLGQVLGYTHDVHRDRDDRGHAQNANRRAAPDQRAKRVLPGEYFHTALLHPPADKPCPRRRAL